MIGSVYCEISERLKHELIKYRIVSTVETWS